MTTSKARPENLLCSVVSKAAGEDTAGCGAPFASYLGVEIAPPWKYDVTESPRFPEGLREAVDGAQDAGAIGKFTALFPDPVYSSREGYARALYLRKPPGPFAAYEKSEYAVPEDEIVPLPFGGDGHWHLELVPRLTVLAGVELGAGIYVNAVPPEDAAEALRGAAS